MSTNGSNVTEDADMAECDGDKVVTMMDVLQEQQDFEEDANAVLGASDDKNCTYPKGYIKRQALYACLTCCSEAKEDPTKRAGVCLACSLTCHENHELIELYTKRNFRCDCGNPKFNSHPCQFTPNKTDLNDNIYNQNFSGLYCVCHRPYPDPDATIEDDMIQCIICEDWLHASHLEATVPPHDQYAEMICKVCMEKNDFLHDYSDLAVNVETDVDIVTLNGNDAPKCNGNLAKNKESSETSNVTNENDVIMSEDKVETDEGIKETIGDNVILNKENDVSKLETSVTKPANETDNMETADKKTNFDSENENVEKVGQEVESLATDEKFVVQKTGEEVNETITQGTNNDTSITTDMPLPSENETNNYDKVNNDGSSGTNEKVDETMKEKPEQSIEQVSMDTEQNLQTENITSTPKKSEDQQLLDDLNELTSEKRDTEMTDSTEDNPDNSTELKIKKNENVNEIRASANEQDINLTEPIADASEKSENHTTTDFDEKIQQNQDAPIDSPKENPKESTENAEEVLELNKQVEILTEGSENSEVLPGVNSLTLDKENRILDKPEEITEQETKEEGKDIEKIVSPPSDLDKTTTDVTDKTEELHFSNEKDKTIESIPENEPADNVDQTIKDIDHVKDTESSTKHVTVISEAEQTEDSTTSHKENINDTQNILNEKENDDKTDAVMNAIDEILDETSDNKEIDTDAQDFNKLGQGISTKETKESDHIVTEKTSDTEMSDVDKKADEIEASNSGNSTIRAEDVEMTDQDKSGQSGNKVDSKSSPETNQQSENNQETEESTIASTSTAENKPDNTTALDNNTQSIETSNTELKEIPINANNDIEMLNKSDENPELRIKKHPKENDITDSGNKTPNQTECNEHKRKFDTEIEDVSAKKAKFDDPKPCLRPKNVKRIFKGATFWPCNFRQKLCTCGECISMYKDLNVLFIIDPEDTVTAYERLGKENIGISQYEKGLEALSSLDRIQQINALTEYNKMRDKLLDFLKNFKERKEVVKEEDIKAFFAGMKPRREPDGVYFCR